ncbi:MAG: hypothetical protein LBE07_11365 [Gordonia sp. (in: high G+C Gram-positive bacteria)]|jgi:hypothetical protein|nr:hypothetical protein [Gordonia sp. (in: high G+C Gram-positive bacteria)]
MKRSIAGAVGAFLLAGAATLVVGCSAEPLSAEQTTVDEPLTPCAFAEADDLVMMVQNSDLSERLAWPITFEHVDCSGDSAIAHTMPDGRTQPTGVLFRYSDGTWRALDVGTSIDCAAFGVPASDVGRLGGCMKAVE